MPRVLLRIGLLRLILLERNSGRHRLAVQWHTVLVIAYELGLRIHHLLRLAVQRHSVLVVAYELGLAVHHLRLAVYRHSVLIITDDLRLLIHHRLSV